MAVDQAISDTDLSYQCIPLEITSVAEKVQIE